MPPRLRSSASSTQAVRLERLQVVVDLLAGEADPAGERRGRRRLDAARQQPGPDRVERDCGGGGVLDHLDVVHGVHVRA